MSLFARSATSLFRTAKRSSTTNTTRTINSTKTNVYANLYAHAHTRGFQSTTARMGVHNLASKAEFTAALKDNKIVILDCFATWCGPCKVIAPQVVKFSDEFPDAHFAKLDVDEVPDVAQELGIRAMPTFLIFKDGEKVKEVVGANPNALKSAIEASVV
ncbi:thioredoxin-like protein [Leptodontidium sp. 2 PMI_412]|nr:thioredoxin-like protein [Leptodontidium sp. MPI-SDFR-AT-0119]KAH9218144.1 thioredoxin-like protein [Leptodontidium sp. 2 PMI_412]